MRNLAEPTQALVVELHKHASPSLWTRWRDRDDPRVALIHAIGERGEAAAIPHLLDSALSDQPAVAQAAVEVMGHLLFALPVTDLIALDRRLRERFFLENRRTRAWDRMLPAALQHTAFEGRHYVTFIALASCHAGGYVREEAVELLAALDTGEELPFLLLRLNDWGAPVRERAAKAVQDRLVPDYAAHFMRALPLVFQLEARERHDVPELPEQVKALLLDELSMSELRAGLSHPEQAVRRACYRMVLDGPPSLRTAAFDQGLDDADVLIRLRTAEALCARMPPVKQDYIERMLENAFMPVRRHALLAMVEHAPGEAEPYLQRTVLDPHRSMRALARYHLSKRGARAFAPRYREALRTSRSVATLKASIGGLGETGGAEDAHEIARYLTADVVSVRRAALAAIARLDGAAYHDRIVAALQDDAPSVSRSAARLLAEHRDWVDVETLWRLFSQDARRHVRAHALSVLARRPRWQRLPYLIQAAATDDPVLAAQAQQYIDQWLSRSNQVFLGPTSDEATFVQALLDERGHLLSDEAVATIQRLLTTFAR